MFLPSDYLAKIAHGKNADQTAEDGRLFIPPVLVMAPPVPRPAETTNGLASGKVINDSIVTTWNQYANNQIAHDDTMGYILSGLWLLQLEVACVADFVIPMGSAVNFDLMDQQGRRVNLISFFGDGVNTIREARQIERLIHIKPRPDLNVVQGDVWTLFAGMPATNAVATNEIYLQVAGSLSRFL